MKKIYTPSDRKMNVFVFFSGGASSLKAMIDDPDYEKAYSVVGAYTDKENAKGREICRDAKIPDIFISRSEFYRQHFLNPKEELSRMKFYEMLTKELEQFKPDIIAMSGYMHIVSDPLLSEYHDRILNVHPADLTILSSGTLSPVTVSRTDALKATLLKNENSF